MKKLAALSVALVTLSTPAAFADTILGIYVGAGVWQTDLSGDLGVVPIDIDDLGLKDEDSNFYYVALEHPVPVLPNIRLQQVDLTLSETSTISQSFQFDNVTYTVNSDVYSDVDLSHMDLTLYYELLDNWVSVDLGLTARIFDGYASLENQTIPSESERVDLDATLPLLYLKTQFDLPFSGFYVTAVGNAVGYDGHSLTDLSAGVGYQSDGLALDLGFEVGIRSFTIELDDLDNELNADVDLSGTYATFFLHF